MKLIIAGGCGEHGRNCFHVEGAYTSFLVDCGILAGEPGGGYPHLSSDEARQLKCVFLTHSHADHTGALPWLRQLGYTGPVVASRNTLEQLPFHLEAGIALEELCPHGEGTLCGITIQWGRSGHCVGSVWYRFTLERKTILFSGDYTETTQVYAFDPIRGQRADMAVLDCAYGYDQKSYVDACVYLVSRVCRLMDTHGLVVFPVPKYGRGLELLRLLHGAGVEGPFFGDVHFLREIGKLTEYRNWLKDDPKQLQPLVKPYSGTEKRGILFLSDPQLRSDDSRTAVRLALAAGGKAVMTGTAERGSYSAQLLEAGQMEMLRYPVHLNRAQMETLAGENSFSKVIAYHCPEIPSEEVYRV